MINNVVLYIYSAEEGAYLNAKTLEDGWSIIGRKKVSDMKQERRLSHIAYTFNAAPNAFTSCHLGA